MAPNWLSTVYILNEYVSSWHSIQCTKLTMNKVTQKSGFILIFRLCGNKRLKLSPSWSVPNLNSKARQNEYINYVVHYVLHIFTTFQGYSKNFLPLYGSEFTQSLSKLFIHKEIKPTDSVLTDSDVRFSLISFRLCTDLIKRTLQLLKLLL